MPLRLSLTAAALLVLVPVAMAQDAASPAPAASEEPPASAPTATQDGASAAPAPAVETPVQAAPPSSADASTRNAAVLSAIAALSPMIGDVQIVGPWVDGERSGVWRTIMTQSVGETKGNRFFVQQIEEKDGEASVSSSTEVTEIAQLEGAIVGYRADAPAEGQESNLTLFFDIVPLDGEVTETYELFVSPNAPYRFGPASN